MRDEADVQVSVNNKVLDALAEGKVVEITDASYGPPGWNGTARILPPGRGKRPYEVDVKEEE